MEPYFVFTVTFTSRRKENRGSKRWNSKTRPTLTTIGTNELAPSVMPATRSREFWMEKNGRIFQKTYPNSWPQNHRKGNMTATATRWRQLD